MTGRQSFVLFCGLFVISRSTPISRDDGTIFCVAAKTLVQGTDRCERHGITATGCYYSVRVGYRKEARNWLYFVVRDSLALKLTYLDSVLYGNASLWWRRSRSSETREQPREQQSSDFSRSGNVRHRPGIQGLLREARWSCRTAKGCMPWHWWPGLSAGSDNLEQPDVIKERLLLNPGQCPKDFWVSQSKRTLFAPAAQFDLVLDTSKAPCSKNGYFRCVMPGWQPEFTAPSRLRFDALQNHLRPISDPKTQAWGLAKE